MSYKTIEAIWNGDFHLLETAGYSSFNVLKSHLDIHYHGLKWKIKGNNLIINTNAPIRTGLMKILIDVEKQIGKQFNNAEVNFYKNRISIIAHN